MCATAFLSSIAISCSSWRCSSRRLFDSLTGLPNRVLFEDRLKQTMSTAKRYHRGFSVMYLDLDGFKDINDKFGIRLATWCSGTLPSE